jgi:hypothetical protein
MPTIYLAPNLQDQGYTGATGTTPYKPATTQLGDTGGFAASERLYLPACA